MTSTSLHGGSRVPGVPGVPNLSDKETSKSNPHLCGNYRLLSVFIVYLTYKLNNLSTLFHFYCKKNDHDQYSDISISSRCEHSFSWECKSCKCRYDYTMSFYDFKTSFLTGYYFFYSYLTIKIFIYTFPLFYLPTNMIRIGNSPPSCT